MRAGHSDNIHTRSNPSPSTNTHQHNNYGSNSQDPLGEQRDRRVLSVSRPLITTQDPHLEGNNSVSGALEYPNGIGSGSSEISDMSSELILGSGTTSGLGYDGTQPIAYIIVPDPQLYLPRLANDAPAPHRQELSVSKGHPNTETSDQTHSRRDDKALPLGKTVHNPGVTPHTTQIESHAPNSGLYHHSDAQLMSSKANLDDRQIVPNKSQDHPSNPGPHPVKTYHEVTTQAGIVSEAPSRHKNARRLGRTDQTISYNNSAPITINSKGETEIAPGSMIAQSSSSTRPGYVHYNQNLQRNNFQGQPVMESSVAHTYAPIQALDKRAGTMEPVLITSQAYYSNNTVTPVNEGPVLFSHPSQPKTPHP
ncbi:hypothetical protein RSOLAG1IB_06789 [Rhizoctonia solani AG-1 IB]|uniref:Uncharacterized protein n=1 Tax=Thanatephorus cucumeris (strain AG1-IB / isolate 7/3/14) TaxID=1108050 RepID=A0A0B7FB22_THACB|nr:hypothetical protein RSOLAG1IB_06789 [Rhizoctonia solani AG-1 IB]